MGEMRSSVELENTEGRHRSRNPGPAADVVEHLGLEKQGTPFVTYAAGVKVRAIVDGSLR